MKHILSLLIVLSFIIGCGTKDPGTSPVSKNPSTPAEESKGIILLRYTPGSQSTEQREEGFLETIQKDYPQIEILSSDQYAGTTPDSSLSKAQQMLSKYGDNITGIFAVCEPNANGVLVALEEIDKAGKVKFMGFDPNDRMVQALEEKKMDGIVLQDPVTMGYLAVKTMVAHLNGEKVEKRVSTGEAVATPDNMTSDRMSALLSPEQLDDAPDAPENAKYRIAVIPKGLTHEFWKSVHYGAQKAADEAGNIEITWSGPQQEGDRESQINIVQNFITQKVDGICLAPLDSQALISVVKEAKDAGIPTVVFDSGLDDEDAIVSYVATDNFNGGVEAAHALAEALGHSRPEKSTEE
ncbi:MAG: substrate-binding domain-containing protein [Pirellulales bacterium]